LFWSALLAFMGAMIGLALADSLILLFVFWEVTTITSFLLIGMHYDEEGSRQGAVQSFLVTGAGGLALLAGIALIGGRAGTFDLSALAAQKETILADPVHRIGLVLMLLGALTKSAQFPFHFWLPGAMAAPTPVSAFLHSAAMVKAGILLIGRLLPVFGESDVWLPVLATVGLTTYVITGWLALRATDLKELLAFSTAGFLGLITAFYGYAGRQGSEAEFLHILNHAAYKAALFFLVGWLDKASGTRDLGLLESQRWWSRSRPAAVLFGIGTLAMAGLPMTLGFMSKEEFYEIVMGGKFDGLTPALAAVIVGSSLMVAYSLKIFIGVFFGSQVPSTGQGTPPEKRSAWLLIVPGILLAVQVVGGLVPHWLLGEVLSPGHEWPSSPAIWHYVDALLVISLISYAAGLVLFLGWHVARRLPGIPGPKVIAEALSNGVVAIAEWWTRVAQAGGHPRYLSVILLTFVAAGALGLGHGRATLADLIGPWGPNSFVGLLPALMILTAAVFLLVLRRRISKLIMLTVAGYGIVVVYMIYQAPDLALTQILTEAVALILLLLIFRQLPDLGPDRRSIGQKVVHGAVSSLVGLTLAGLAWGSASQSPGDRAGAEHLRLSGSEQLGENVVNVILTDFRALDTLGEIIVLALAALGVAVLYRARRRSSRSERPSAQERGA
jgi:NADH:ubiquinone oxidoreductase subunit 5 (subunit L)/multisubunit Na+/H+ antiporter MnhA subunit